MKQIRYILLIGIVALLTVSVQQISAQDHQHTYGDVDFSISCSEEAQKAFTNGLALLHHMMYEQAEAQFTEASKADPKCAMAHWGVAMTVIHPLWGERPTDEALQKGEQALAKAKELPPPTERERAYIKALEPFFDGWNSTEYADQLNAFESGYKQLHTNYPDDIDGAAFYALGHLATAPKEDKNFTHQKKAGKLLERLYAEAPRHPGLSHYIIHSYDNPMLASHAIDVARGYDKIAPEVPHALHMPSHIFVRRGLWEDVIDWNQRSAEAALRYPVDGMVSMHYAHAMDYLTYAYLQRGEDKKAHKVLETVNAASNQQPSLATAYAIAAVNARYPLERRKWDEAAMLPLHKHTNFPWTDFPAAETIIHFTRGMGAARLGDFEDARKAIAELKTLRNKLTDAGEDYWATLTDAQRITVMAWLAYAEEEEDRALALMKEAADKEDALDKHPVTPGHMLPARELLGDMLLKMNHPKEALQAYEASLATSAQRFNSLFGAAQAAELLGDTKKAKHYYTMLMDMSAKDDSGRPAIFRARKFVAEN